MSKITNEQLHQHLDARNQQNPDKPVCLHPKNQKYQSQNAYLRFKCDLCKHTWYSTYYRIIKKQAGCPKCKYKKDSQTKRLPFDTFVEQANQTHNNYYTYNKEEYNGLMKFMTTHCPKHGPFQVIPFNHIKKGQYCPGCNKDRLFDDFVQKAQYIHDNKYRYDQVDVYKNAITKVQITCPEHGVFEQRPDSHIRGHGCPKCVDVTVSKKQITWLEHIANQQNVMIQHACNKGEFNPPSIQGTVDGYCEQTNTIYQFHGDAFHGNLNRYASDEHCHPFKANVTAKQLYEQTINRDQQLRALGYNVVTIWESDFDKLQLPLINIDYNQIVHQHHQTPHQTLQTLQLTLVDQPFKGYKHKHNYQCLHCGQQFDTTLSQRKQLYKKYGSTGCPSCNKHKTNGVIDSVVQTLNEVHGGWKKTNNVAFNDHAHTAIIMLSVQYDTEQNVGRYLALNQKQALQQQGYDTTVFFEDEWFNKQQIIVSKMLHKLHVNTLPKIYARNCFVQNITISTKRDFLDQTHIQQNDNSQIAYGAFYKDQLVAVMTFAKPRVFSTQQRSEEKAFELVRFSASNDYRVVGIASKLLKRFEREYQPQQIISYADRRWSIGNLYDQLGFELERTNPPDYFYIIDGQRKHRWNYRKDRLREILPNYDPNLTEYQNMLNAGYDRIWGCGTLCYTKNNINP